MAGIGHEDFEGRIPCPYCSSTDCLGIEWDGEPNEARDNCHTVCCATGRRFDDEDLVRSALEHGLRRRLDTVTPTLAPPRRPSALSQRALA